jgi:hypothetical protein
MRKIWDLLKDFINDLIDGFTSHGVIMDKEYRALLDRGVNPLTIDKFNEV